MIPRDWKPTSHITPRPPIEINPRKGITLGGPPSQPLSPVECERLWNLVKQAAQGICAPVDEPVVDMTGWEPA
jgi:hypothetical protein